MKSDQRPFKEKQARKELKHAKRQVDLFRDRLMMSGNEPSALEAYQKAQQDYQAKWKVLLELTIPETAEVG